MNPCKTMRARSLEQQQFRMKKPWQNNITGYEPGTAGVKISNGFGGDEEAVEVSTLNCFQ